MQNAGVESASDDRRVGKSTGTTAQEFVHEFRFNLVFHHTRFYELQDTLKPRFGDVAGTLHLFHLFL